MIILILFIRESLLKQWWSEVESLQRFYEIVSNYFLQYHVKFLEHFTFLLWYKEIVQWKSKTINWLKQNIQRPIFRFSLIQETFALEGYGMNYVKYLDLINYGKQATVFTETLVHALNINFYGYWNVTTKLKSWKTLSLN